MAYTNTNFKTKKALKDAVNSGVAVYCHEPYTGRQYNDRRIVFIEGPHYPQPHRWYAECHLGDDGRVTKVK